MTIPKWHECMGPILNVLSDGQPRERKVIVVETADRLGITPEEREERLSSGIRRYVDRFGWAISHLARVGCVDRRNRGIYTINDRGCAVLAQYPEPTKRDIDEMAGQPRSILQPKPDLNQELGSSLDEELNPLEMIEVGIAQIHEEVAQDLLDRLTSMPPTFFEDAVVQLLMAMGYGGTEGAGRVTQATNDGGIDGVIDQDALGLNQVYVQAKRYGRDNSVGRPDIQSFIGALSARASGGIFFTTGSFTASARAEAERVPINLILVDGERLASLMIHYGVGVQVKETVHVVEIDEDFFD